MRRYDARAIGRRSAMARCHVDAMSVAARARVGHRRRPTRGASAAPCGACADTRGLARVSSSTVAPLVLRRGGETALASAASSRARSLARNGGGTARASALARAMAVRRDGLDFGGTRTSLAEVLFGVRAPQVVVGCAAAVERVEPRAVDRSRRAAQGAQRAQLSRGTFAAFARDALARPLGERGRVHGGCAPP